MRYTSRTGSGISMNRSVLTSCLMSSIGKSGARISGPMGSRVPGWRRAGQRLRQVRRDVVVVRRQLALGEHEPALLVAGTSVAS